MFDFKFKQNSLNFNNLINAKPISFGLFKPQNPVSSVITNFKLKPFGGRNDRDFDGVANRFDCQPRNTMRQDSWKKDPFLKNVYHKYKMIPIFDIEPIEDNQKRSKIDQIKQSGDIKIPISVKNKYYPEQKYQLYQGHHRFLAAKERGDRFIPAQIVDNRGWTKEYRERKMPQLNIAVPLRTPVENEWERETILKQKLQGKVPQDILEGQRMAELIIMTKGLDKKAIENVAEDEIYYNWSDREVSEGERLGAPIWKAIGGDDTASSAIKEKQIMGREEEVKKALLKYNPNPENVEVYKALLKNPSAVDFYYGEGPTGKITSIRKTYDNPEFGEQYWTLTDEDRRSTTVNFYPKNKKVELNSYGGYENERYSDYNYEDKEKGIQALKEITKEKKVEGASEQKQEEWADKTEIEKDTERITEQDVDGDSVPDKYDCEPNNPEEQDKAANQRILNERAKKHFGTTKNPFEAGYILPTGEMLDLSGRHQQPNSYKKQGDMWVKKKNNEVDYQSNRRDVDHRELYEVFEGTKIEDKNKPKGYDNNYDNNTINMKQFMQKGNALRVGAYKGGTFFVAAYENQDITPSQKRTINQMYKELEIDQEKPHYPPQNSGRPEINFDIYNDEGYPITDYRGSRADTPSQFINTFETFKKQRKKQAEEKAAESFRNITADKCELKGSCDRIRQTPEGERYWQDMMKAKREIPEQEFLENAQVKDVLDEGETWEEYKRTNPDVKFYKAGDDKFFFQTAGFEFVYDKDKKPASEEKQQEWAEKTEVEKDTERITEPDADGEGVPDEYDCEPEDPTKDATVLGKLVNKKTREGGWAGFAGHGSKSSINYEYNRLQKIRTPEWKEDYEYRNKQFMGGVGSFLNKALSQTRERFDSEKDRFVKERNIPFTPLVSDSRTPNADWVEEKQRDKLNKEVTFRKQLKDRLIEKGYLDYDDKDIKKDYYNSIESLEQPTTWVEVGKEDEEIEKLQKKIFETKTKEVQKGASEQKQQEWADKTEVEKDTERITEPDADGDSVPDEYDCEPENSEKQDTFTPEQEKEINSIDWTKDQKGKELGHGHFGNVYEIKDNPKYVLKVDNTKRPINKSTGEVIEPKIKDTDREYHIYEKMKTMSIIAPTVKTSQGLVREKMDIVTRGITRDDDRTSPNVKGITFVENKDLTHTQLKKVVGGVNQMTYHNIGIWDNLQVGVVGNKKPYIYDIGEVHKSDMPDWELKNQNDTQKKRFLESVEKEDYYDVDEEKEAREAKEALIGGFDSRDTPEFRVAQAKKEIRLKGASEQKQQEWAEMPLEEKKSEQMRRLDTDADKVPDEYDCEPKDPTKDGGRLYWEELKKKNINLDNIPSQLTEKRINGNVVYSKLSPKERKKIRHIFEKRPELLEKARNTTFIKSTKVGIKGYDATYQNKSSLTPYGKKVYGDEDYIILTNKVLHKDKEKTYVPETEKTISHEIGHKEYDELYPTSVETHLEYDKKREDFEKRRNKETYDEFDKYTTGIGLKPFSKMTKEERASLSEEDIEKMMDNTLKATIHFDKEYEELEPSETYAFQQERKTPERDIIIPEEQVEASFKAQQDQYSETEGVPTNVPEYDMDWGDYVGQDNTKDKEKKCPTCGRVDCVGECPYDTEEGRSEIYYSDEG